MKQFGPQVKKYLKKKQLPLKWLLAIDNATAHPKYLEDDSPNGLDFIKVKFLSSNTTHLLQSMDQHVINNFQ